MGLRIATNVQSIAAQRALGKTNEAQSRSLEKLASGERIVRAGDDAAGLAISEKLRAHIRGTRQATRNSNDGISLIQTAEGGLNEVGNILVRLRELSVQSASDTIGESERAFTDLEFQNLIQEVDRISSVTEFNGKKLLNGETEQLDFQVGINNNEGQDRIHYKGDEVYVTSDNLGIQGLSVSSKEGAQENLEAIDTAISVVNASRANLGALQNRLQSTVNNLMVADENMSAAKSRIRDVDVAQESAELVKNNILSAAGTTVLTQANTNGSAALKLIS